MGFSTDINRIIFEKNRRLQKLKEQEARHGINTDPAILIEIEDLEDEIRGLQTNRHSQSRNSGHSRYASEFSDTTSAYVTILLDQDIRKFGFAQREELVGAIARIVNCDPKQIRILRVEAGSVKLTLEMPTWAAHQLYARSLENAPEFRVLSILSIEVHKDHVVASEATAQPSSIAEAKPIKILFLAANPRDTNRLRLDEEIRSIDEAIAQSRFRDEFEIKQQWAVRVEDLQRSLLRHRPNIVHFSGHGSGSEGIILEDSEGNSRPLSTEDLTRLFTLLKDDIRCVVLDACYSEEQAHAIGFGIDVVIGMASEISDRAAIQFASAFYEALAYGRDLETAFDLGKLRILMSGLSERNLPRLIALRADPREISFTGSTVRPKENDSGEAV